MLKITHRFCTVLLLLGVFAANCYRAATQSVVHDEALNWNWYLSGPVSAIFTHFDANNHFLATLLTRASVELFGHSALTMRLPTLAAGALLFWSLYQLLALAVRDGILFFIGAAALALNPFLLDFLVISRGYGLAMAALFWALLQMVRYLASDSETGRDHRCLWKSALGLVAAFAANLTLIVPSAVLAAVFLGLVWRVERQAGESHLRRADEETRETESTAAKFAYFLVPFAALSLLFALISPIRHAHAADFYVGAGTAAASVKDLLASSFAYQSSTQGAWLWGVLVVLALAVAGGVMVASSAIGSPSGSLAALASAAVAGSALLLGAAHGIANVMYPVDRTGLYFVPLATLSGVALLAGYRTVWPKTAWYGALAVLSALAVVYAAQFQVSSFRVWRYDADTNHLFAELERRRPHNGTVRLGVNWLFEPTLNYYRVTRHATAWLKPVVRDGLDGERQFYVLTPDELALIKTTGLKGVFRGATSDAVLAVR